MKPKKHSPPPPTPEELAQRALDEAEWLRAKGAVNGLFKRPPETRVQNLYLYEAATQSMKVPSFQRGYTWTPEQALDLHQRLLDGRPIGPILLWDRKDGVYILDGQQRLVTLGVTVTRKGEPVVGHSVYFCPDILGWTLEPGPDRFTVCELAGLWLNKSPASLRMQDLRNRSWYKTCILLEVLGRLREMKIPMTLLGGWTSVKATPKEALAWFRTYNSGGTPMDQETLDGLSNLAEDT